MNRILKKRYHILSPLGQSQWGVTYLAVDLSLPHHPQCVLKQLIPHDLRPEVLRIIKTLFRKQVIQLQKLGKHDQIAQILAYFEEDGKFYIVQEFIEGHDLTQEIRPSRKMSAGQVIHFLVEVLNILQYIHDQNSICCALNLRNLIRRKSDGRIVLVDFGYTKEIMGLSMNNFGKIIHRTIPINPEYSPREQTEGNAQPCSDIYALGKIAIEALTGLPHSQFTDWKQETKVSECLETLLDSMINENWLNRYQNTQQVFKDLNGIKDSNKGIKIALPIFFLMIISLMTYTNTQVQSQENIPLLSVVEDQYQDVESYWKKGSSYYFQKDYDQAIAYYTKALELDPKDILAYDGRGKAYIAQEKYEEAIADYNQAIAINSNYAAFYNHRGAAYYRKGDIEQSLKDYNKTLQIDPDFALTYNNFGVMYHDQGNDKKAIYYYTKSIQLNTNLIYPYYNRADIYYQQGEYDNAIPDYTKAIELDPTHINAYIGRGYSYSDKGLFESAISDLSKVIELDPQAYYPYANRANIYYEHGEYQKALADYNKAIELNPQDADLHNNRGRSYYKLGEYQKAIVAYTQAIDLNPDTTCWYGNRANAYYKNGDYQQAIAGYTEVIQRDIAKHNRAFPSEYYWRGRSYDELGEYEKAIDNYTIALELDSVSKTESADIYNGRGWVYYQQGEYQKAISDYKQAIELDSTLAYVYRNLGLVYDRLGDLDQAIANYNQAIQIDPNYANAYYSRGLVYQGNQNKQAAIQDFQKAAYFYKQEGSQEWYQESLNRLEELGL